MDTRQTIRKLEDHIRSERRFFYDQNFQDEISNLVHVIRKAEINLPADSKFWRARIGKLNLAEMKPDDIPRSSGRANPFGMIYLYCAGRRAIAVAENRPWIGSEVTCVRLKSNKILKIVDISRNGISKISELTFDEKELIEEISFLFSKPVSKNEDDRSYIFTQLIAEKLLTLSYDGIAYDSALWSSSGDTDKNYVFFNPSDIDFTGRIEFRSIVSINYKLDDHDSNNDYGDSWIDGSRQYMRIRDPEI